MWLGVLEKFYLCCLDLLFSDIITDGYSLASRPLSWVLVFGFSGSMSLHELLSLQCCKKYES